MNTWKKYDGNPVFGCAELGTCFDANVISGYTKKFTMYFSWRPKKSLAIIHSDDGVHWTDPEIILQPNRDSGWEDDINRSCTLVKDGFYHLWYTGQSRGFSRIGYAVSTDGVHFQRKVETPVLIPERPHEGFSVMNPYVLYDSEKKLYRMWYAAGETYEPNVICYAESRNGIHWEKSMINPIFVKGNMFYDCDRVGGCEVHKLSDGSYVMFYIGYEDINKARICMAFSPDGITRWKRSDMNPIVQPDMNSWDEDACYKPTVFFEKDKQYLWYNGRKQHDEFIGIALCDKFIKQ